MEFKQEERQPITLLGLKTEFLNKPVDTVVETYIEEIQIPVSLLEKGELGDYDFDYLDSFNTETDTISVKLRFKYRKPMVKTSWLILEKGDSRSFIPGAFYIGHQSQQRYIAVSNGILHAMSEYIRPAGAPMVLDTDFTEFGSRFDESSNTNLSSNN